MVDLFVYLRTDPEVVRKRIRKRSRREEDPISIVSFFLSREWKNWNLNIINIRNILLKYINCMKKCLSKNRKPCGIESIVRRKTFKLSSVLMAIVPLILFTKILSTTYENGFKWSIPMLNKNDPSINFLVFISQWISVVNNNNKNLHFPPP